MVSILASLENFVFEEQTIVTVRSPFWSVVPAYINVALSMFLPHSEDLSHNRSIRIIGIFEQNPVSDLVSSSLVNQKRNRHFGCDNVAVIAVWPLHFQMIQSGDVGLQKMDVVKHGRVGRITAAKPLFLTHMPMGCSLALRCCSLPVKGASDLYAASYWIQHWAPDSLHPGNRRPVVWSRPLPPPRNPRPRNHHETLIDGPVESATRFA
ncbi:hypothetical protein OGATHE_000080 [Ogataea polymorpha]|uniref:Uncharacterized protein n=1 Tax=Ogataea polymorpha TaxID=460523 RepID=A0A9P8THB1_9ASCO|nr:hypothetical protein OGATHE_000080 [Ogataea polymorpha]